MTGNYIVETSNRWQQRFPNPISTPGCASNCFFTRGHALGTSLIADYVGTFYEGGEAEVTTIAFDDDAIGLTWFQDADNFYGYHMS